MSAGVCGNDNRTTSNNLSYTLQSVCSITLDGNNEHMRKECDKSDQHVEPCEPIESTSCTASGTPCTRSPTCNEYGIPCRHSRATPHTSFPCAHCRDHDSTTAGLVRKHKYTSITAARECSSAADYIERDYADYIAATSAQGQGASTGVRVSDESRNFKQADADSGDSVERRIGIPAGVTI